jgi:hypothetical protein
VRVGIGGMEVAAAQAAGHSRDDERPDDPSAAEEAGREVRPFVCGGVDLFDDPGMGAVGEHANVD